MFTTVSQTDSVVTLEVYPPTRIVSLVPSQTELLYALGLEDEVVGITKFCVHPRAWFNTKKRVGGTKAIHIDVVKALEPQLIIANKEENVKEQVIELESIAPVWVSDINSLGSALDTIKRVGELVGRVDKATTIINDINLGFKRLILPEHPIAIGIHKPRVAYLIWQEPYMAAGGDTFISDMLARCGFANAFGHIPRYPETTVQQLAFMQCDYIFLSSEPYPFKEKHAEELRGQLPNTSIVFVDGEMFSWYGSRLVLAAQYFFELQQRLIQTAIHV